MEFKHCSIAGILYLEGSKETLINVREIFVFFFFILFLVLKLFSYRKMDFLSIVVLYRIRKIILPVNMYWNF